MNNIFIIYFYLLENTDFACKINVFLLFGFFAVFIKTFHKLAYSGILKPSMLVKMLVKQTPFLHFTNPDICRFLMAEKHL